MSSVRGRGIGNNSGLAVSGTQAHSRVVGLAVRCRDLVEFRLSLLKWTYLLTALGAASTNSGCGDGTAERGRKASRIMRPTEPFHTTNTSLVQLCLAAIGFVVIILQPPPETLVAVGFGWVVLVRLPRAMSNEISIEPAWAEVEM